MGVVPYAWPVPVVSIRSRGGPPGADRLVRDRMTLTLYGSYVTWGWLLYSFNPSVPLLAADQHISDAQAGLHGTAMAVGGLAAAFLTPRVVLRRGRRLAIVVAATIVAVGVTALVLGPSLPWTLGAMLVMSIGGNLLIGSTQVGIALHHGPTASAAITEANGAGSGIGLLGPIAVGAAVSLGWGWRPAVLVTGLLALVVAVYVWRLPATPSLPARPTRTALAHDEQPAPAATRPHERWRPGPAAALFLVGIVATVGVENGTTYWSTQLLIDRTGAQAGIATAATAGLVAGMTAMRFVVGPLSLRIRPAPILAGGFLLNIVGWAVVWTTTSTPVALAGLVLAGLGLGVQYPMSIVLLLAASPGHSDRAQGEATMFGALSIGVLPFLLGAISDRYGMHTAFTVIPLLALTGAVAAVAGGRALKRAAQPVVA